jgi:hypothetical protein
MVVVASSCPSITSTLAQPLSVCEGHPTLGVAGAGVASCILVVSLEKKGGLDCGSCIVRVPPKTNYKLSPQSLAMYHFIC